MCIGATSRDCMTLDILILLAGAGDGKLVGDGVSSPGIGGMGRGGDVGPGSGSM